MTSDGRGLFVTFDGPGGAGKSTLVAAVHRSLADAALNVHATTEPTDTELGRLIRGGTDRYRGAALAHLVVADRHQHLTEINPLLDAGTTVLCDRYVASTLVLQALDGVDPDLLWTLNRDFRHPDLSVIVTATPQVRAERLAARGAHSRFERDPRLSAREDELFGQTATVLRLRGFNVWCVDNSSTTVDQTAGAIAQVIKDTIEQGNP
jgi:dTMP kinase